MLSEFWKGFFQLPIWFVMSYLIVLLLGLIAIVHELANRKLSITKVGVTFDRLREKKGWVWWKRKQKEKEKIPLMEERK